MSDPHDYIRTFLRPIHPELEVIAEEERAPAANVQPGVGLEVGRLLGLLCRVAHAQRVLELGTSLGYSTLWLAEALGETGGRLVTIEREAALLERARAHAVSAGVESRVEFVQGHLPGLLYEVEGPFDLILLDADKTLYPDVLDRCVALLRPAGLLVADDALFRPMGVAPRLADPVHRYNERAFQHPRLFSTLLPIGDGVVVSVKRS